MFGRIWVLVWVAALAPLSVYAEGIDMQKVAYGGWANCVKLTNGKIELIATTDVGPRIIRFGFVGGQNLFKEYPEQMGKTGGDKWCIYGGHRLWHAPENIPRTYWPDNDPVDAKWDGKTLTLTPLPEKANGIQKQIEIAMDEKANRVRLLHRLVNLNPWEIELAPWSLTVMTQKGRAIYPQEPFIPHEEYLLPARPIALWHYTQMADPRWIWGNKYIQLKQDPKASGKTMKQKIGFFNKQGWAAYFLDGDLFIKRFDVDPNGRYPDFGCNTETFTDSEMLEVESLGPLARLAPNGGKAEHTEVWSLDKVQVGEDEASLDAKVLPLVGK